MGNCVFHGCDTVELARTYGTPLYVVSEDEIAARIRRLKDCFDRTGPNRRTYYASKAYLTRDMVRLLMEMDVGLDVVSGGELFLARQMAFPPDRIAFHGNSKTAAEIADGLDYGVGQFVCDSTEEMLLIDALATEKGKRAKVLIRVTPGVDSHTHVHISTAGADSKFGVPLACIDEAVSLCGRLEGVSLQGFHFHVGSQLLTNDAHLQALDILLALILRLRQDLAFTTEILDLGGGFGVRYTEDDEPLPIEDFIRPLIERTERFCAACGMDVPALVIEPGRWIVAEAGVTLYTVGSVKEIPGGTTYVGVDGGYPDNPRPELYQARYEAIVANRVGEPADRCVTLAGKCCESGDILIRDVRLPLPRRGDIVAVFATGAYHHSMANNYNKNPLPATVAIRDGVARLSVRRQTCAELYERDL